jgi:hypothetical protein
MNGLAIQLERLHDAVDGLHAQVREVQFQLSKIEQKDVLRLQDLYDDISPMIQKLMKEVGNGIV